MRNAYKILVVKPHGKRPLGRRRHIWMLREEIGSIGSGNSLLEGLFEHGNELSG
jgi:hypothetical protein